MGSMFGGGSDDTSTQAELQRQGRIKEGMKAIESNFAGFDPNFYKARGQSYQDWALPQVEQQYEEARKQLQFNLARQYGTLDTSTAGEENAKLASQLALAKTGVADSAGQYAQKAKAAMEGQRGTLTSQLYSTADPAMAATSAMRSAELLNAQDPMEPLGQLFYNVGEGLASAAPTEGIASYYKNRSPGIKPSNKASSIIT